MLKILKTLLAGALLAGTCAAAPISYLFTIDTTPFAGTSGIIEWSLLPADISSPAVSALITQESYSGGTAGAYTPIGDATAAPPLLGNSQPDNRVLRDIVSYGTGISFWVTLDGPGLSPGGLQGTTFSVSLYDAGGIAAPPGLAAPLLGGIDIDSGLGATIIFNSADPGVITIVSPEPGTALLLPGAALLLLVMRRRSALN